MPAFVKQRWRSTKEGKPLSLQEYLARQIGSDASRVLFCEALALPTDARGRQPYSGPDLELPPVQVRSASVGDGFEAELRADHLMSGDCATGSLSWGGKYRG